MSKKERISIHWRRRSKIKTVAAMGGKCQNPKCGYNKCVDALELHHIDPSKKEFSFGNVRVSPYNLGKLLPELKKCLLLCANCHREYHAGLLDLSGIQTSINEQILIEERNLIIQNKKQNAKFVPEEIKNDPEKRRKFLNNKPMYFTSTQLKDLLHVSLDGDISKLAKVLKMDEEIVKRHMNKVSLLNME